MSHGEGRATRPVVGIVGGVGSGKSALTAAVCERLASGGGRVRVIDGDKVGHETLVVPDVIEQIAAEFGDGVVGENGIDRRALGGLVFGDDVGADVRRSRLNAIMHPAMRTVFEQQIATARSEDAVVLFDAAILFESGWNDLCDACVFVSVSDEERESRAVARGWTAARWRATEASQWPIDEKRAAVETFAGRSLVVDNNKSITDAATRVASWIASLSPSTTSTHPTAAGSHSG